MLSVHLKVLDETIAYYENTLLKEIEDQMERLQGILDNLFDSWQGIHADTFHESFSALLYGPGPGSVTDGEAVSLQGAKERAGKILDALKAAREAFGTELSRCEELFYAGLESDTNIFTISPNAAAAYDGTLYIDYEKAESLVSSIEALLNNECDYVNQPENSQMRKWNALLESFDGLHQDHYHPGNADAEIRGLLLKELTKLQNFYYAVGTYKKNLEDTEEALVEAFGEETSKFAAVLTREIYEVYVSGEVSQERILYLSQKSPEAYTAEEMDEIHRILEHTMNEAPKQELQNELIPVELQLSDSQLADWVKNETLNHLFRGYSAALQTTYAMEITRANDVPILSDYFYKDTLTRLTGAGEACNYDQLNRIMELDPDSLTAGDLKALSEVFDGLVKDTGMDSMNSMNQFLANCYINGEGTPDNKLDADRSPVFDQWVRHYLDTIKTTEEDFGVLDRIAATDREKDAVEEVNTKFLKQAMLGLLTGNTSLKLQVRGGLQPDGSGTWNERLGVYDIEPAEMTGDYHLTLWKSYRESGEKIDINYYRYRDVSTMGTLLAADMVSTLDSYQTGFAEYAKDRVQGYIVDATIGTVVDTAEKAIKVSGVGFAIDGAAELGEAGIGWNKQTKKNAEIASALSKYYDGRMLEAYQTSGQIMYVNGVLVVNNSRVDEDAQELLLEQFDTQVSDTENRYKEDFYKQVDAKTEEERRNLDKELLDRTSEVYKMEFINWYHEGKGDSGGDTGERYLDITRDEERVK